MEFDLVKTAAVFVVLNALGVAAMLAMDFMPQRTVLMMVLPSMVLFGLVTLGIGVMHGEYRATR